MNFSDFAKFLKASRSEDSRRESSGNESSGAVNADALPDSSRLKAWAGNEELSEDIIGEATAAALGELSSDEPGEDEPAFRNKMI